MIKPFKLGNLNQYSSVKSFYLAVKINPTVPVSNGQQFILWVFKNKIRAKKMLNQMSCWVKSMKKDSWILRLQTRFTRVWTPFFTFFFQTKDWKMKKTEMKILVQKLAHCTLPFKNLHDSASHTVRNKGFWVARGCKVVELRHWSKHVKTDST